MYIFWSQIYFGITQYKLGKKLKNQLDFVCYGLPYYTIFLEKYAPKFSWLKLKYGHPWKIVQCDNIFAPPFNVLSPSKNCHLGTHVKNFCQLPPHIALPWTF